jgi:hypothetical protein
MPAHCAPYVRPAGLSLMFCSREEILAAPKEEREAYYRIVGQIVDHPEDYGFEQENEWQRKGCKLSANEIDDNHESIRNGDGSIY